MLDEIRLKVKWLLGSLCGYGNGVIVVDVFNSEIVFEVIIFGYLYFEVDVIVSKFWFKGNFDFGWVVIKLLILLFL